MLTAGNWCCHLRLNSKKMASNQGVDIAQLPIPQLSQLSQQLEHVMLAVLFLLFQRLKELLVKKYFKMNWLRQEMCYVMLSLQ